MLNEQSGPEETKALIINHPFSQRLISSIIKWYFISYHHLKIIRDSNTPDKGPVLFLMAHFSHLDAALQAADPINPPTIPVVKIELMKKPVISWALRQLEAIPVSRTGKDMKAVRKILEAFKQERSICIAPEGTRNKTGRLGSMNETAVNIALFASRNKIPIIPIAALGTDKALPPGSWFPRPRQISIIFGPGIDLSECDSQKLKGAHLEEPARIIRDRIAALLPEENQPLPETPALARATVR